MNRIYTIIGLVCLLTIATSNMFSSNIFSAEENSYPSIPKVSGEVFLSAETAFNHEDNTPEEDYTKFSVRRAYLTVKGDISSKMSYRFTMDAFDNENGAEYRLKYLYLSYKLSNLGNIFTDSKLYFGVCSTPLASNIGTINHYRMNEKTFLNRMKITNTADLGVHISGNFGGKLDADYQKNVSSKNNGKWGSYDFGIYNGGGYNHINESYNMTYQARVSLRPLPTILKGFQINAFGLYSKMNIEEDIFDSDEPWYVSDIYLSYQHSRFNLMAEYVLGRGSRFGNFITEDNVAVDYTGYSAFGEFKITPSVSVIGRYDYMDHYASDIAIDFTSISGGLAYRFYNKNTVMLSYDYQTKGDHSTSVVMFTTKLVF